MIIIINDEHIPEIINNLESTLYIIEKYSSITNTDYLPEHLTIRDIISRITGINLWDKEYRSKLDRWKEGN
jgi:hypothetical protein